MFDKLKMINQAREMQKKMGSIVISETFRGVKIDMNGRQEAVVLEIIDTELLNDKDKLQKILLETFNNAVRKSQSETATKMRGEMGGLFGM